MDDIAAEDIPSAIEYVYKSSKEKIILVGHSQGGITSKAALSGLSHCEEGFCFQEAVAEQRQEMVRGMLSIAANQSMSTRYSRYILPELGSFGWFIHSLTRTLVDYIPASEVIRHFSGSFSFADAGFWTFLYSTDHVEQDVRNELYQTTLDGTSSSLVNQYAEAIAHKGIRNSTGEYYVDALKNLHVPTAVVAFELDSMSPPRETYEDTYLRLNAGLRNYFYFPAQRHEDFMLEPRLNGELSGAFDWLMAF